MPRKSAKSRKSRQLGSFHSVPELKRSNPQSLRKALYEITKRKLGEDLSKVSVELKRALRTRQGRTLHNAYSDEVLYRILRDDTHIKYYHLEGYARKLGIPVSLLLLYSRLTANQLDRTPHHNEAMLRSFARIAREALAKLNDDARNPDLFGIDDLLLWITVYEEESAKAEQVSFLPSTEE